MPLALRRHEVIAALVQALSKLDLPDLAHWWEQIIGSPCYVDGDRLYQLDTASEPSKHILPVIDAS